jgi:hypothetical protein
MSNYIHTSGTINFRPFNNSIYKITKTSLVSLIHIFSNSNFGLENLNSGIKKLNAMSDKYLKNCVEYIDSGGFSIINGDIGVNDITKYIECYCEFFKSNNKRFDYIFSLDIPIFINSPNYNTYSFIKKQNNNSLVRTIELIKKNPELKEKAIFVLQFKMHQQYKVWNELYDELECYKYFNTFSVGGLVGLTNFTNLKFSPFIGAAYYFLNKYLKHKELQTRPFQFHVLGIYHGYYRFILYFMQKLFSIYLNQNCLFTFDSINYTITSFFKSRAPVSFYYLDNNEIKYYSESNELSEEFLNNSYFDDDLLLFKDNLKLLSENKKLNQLEFITPAYVYSQSQLDEYFKILIDKYDIIEVFSSAPNTTVLINKLNVIFKNIESNSPFLNSVFSSRCIESLRIIYIFHNWFMNNRNELKLEELLIQFINKINFPFDLAKD